MYRVFSKTTNRQIIKYQTCNNRLLINIGALVVLLKNNTIKSGLITLPSENVMFQQGSSVPYLLVVELLTKTQTDQDVHAENAFTVIISKFAHFSCLLFTEQ